MAEPEPTRSPRYHYPPHGRAALKRMCLDGAPGRRLAPDTGCGTQRSTLRTKHYSSRSRRRVTFPGGVLDRALGTVVGTLSKCAVCARCCKLRRLWSRKSLRSCASLGSIYKTIKSHQHYSCAVTFPTLPTQPAPLPNYLSPLWKLPSIMRVPLGDGRPILSGPLPWGLFPWSASPSVSEIGRGLPSPGSSASIGVRGWLGWPSMSVPLHNIGT